MLQKHVAVALALGIVALPLTTVALITSLGDVIFMCKDMKSGKWTVVWVVCSCRYWTITWLVTHTWLMHESCECDGPVPATTYNLLNCVYCVKAVHKLCPQTSPPFQRILDGVTTLIASVSFLPAWRYASALYAMAWRLSVLYWKRMNGSRSCHDALPRLFRQCVGK